MTFEDKKKIYEKNGLIDQLYAERVGELIRQRYSINDELALHRQRDDKPEEFAIYNTFVEECKAQAYAEVYGENAEV